MLIGTDISLWTYKGIFITIFLPFLLVLILGSTELSYGYYSSIRRRKRIEEMFGTYVPAEHIKKMLNSTKSYGLEGHTREMTVLFSDIRNFTKISEPFTADQLSNLLFTVFTPLTKAIFDNNGTIDKYVGDMIVAFWNAPLDDPQHGKHAIAAALQMQAVIKNLEPQLREQNLPEIQIGIGLNSGLMHVGDMGSEYRRNYTVLGDEVNLGSRIEGATKLYKVSIMCSEATQQHNHHVLFRYLDKIRVKGKQNPVKVYQPICPKEEASQALIQEIEQHEKGMAFYYDRRWEKALQIYESLSSKHPEIQVYKFFKERTLHYIINPPDEHWDGVFVLTEK